MEQSGGDFSKDAKASRVNLVLVHKNSHKEQGVRTELRDRPCGMQMCRFVDFFKAA